MFRLTRSSLRSNLRHRAITPIYQPSSQPLPSSTFSFALTRSVQAQAIQPTTSSSSSQRSFSTSQHDSSYELRHIGPQLRADKNERDYILSSLGVSSLDELMKHTVPSNILLTEETALQNLKPGVNERDALNEMKEIMNENVEFKSYVGMGYYNTITPSVLLRCIIENPSWYTPYTPYQAEISQGRMEMLVNFQTMISDLVGKDLCNCSLLDEGTACAEAMAMCLNVSKIKKGEKPIFLVSENCHVQSITVTQTRAEPLGIEVRVVPDEELVNNLEKNVVGVLLQYPNTNGAIDNFEEFAQKAHENKSLVVCATDLLACASIKPPGEWGADIVVGTSQRFGVPLGFGGPHAAFLATDSEYIRKMPGRIIGITRDSRGKAAYRMTLQTREQHIRREKATSNICTAQALLANVAAAYGVYHGPDGIKRISSRVNNYTKVLSNGLKEFGCVISNDDKFFDTITVELPRPAKLFLEKSWEHGINLRPLDMNKISISIDETTTLNDINNIFAVFEAVTETTSPNANELFDSLDNTQSIPSDLVRSSAFMEHEVFNSHHSETAMMRYLYSLEKKDFGLNSGMIPLGSCTMKLNAASAMIPLTWSSVNNIHPFAPSWQTKGYLRMINEMEEWLADITAFDSVSLQPNSGAQGEYTGLMCIRAYHVARNEGNQRNICLIPKSAHGTNPASAAAVGWKVVAVECDNEGNVDMDDLRRLASKYSDSLAACMVTYPSTHGVFEEDIQELCNVIHENGGLVYMDGANMQAQVGYCAPGLIGADVCHLNLHKTFCIPHGGGGPGLGPIGVNSKLTPYLPTHPVVPCGKDEMTAIGAIASSPWSSASIITIPWMYIRMMGGKGLRNATSVAIASANYMAKKLENDYKILYRGKNGFCAHEFILDLSEFEKEYGVTSEDIAKRLMDYGFHAPTMSFPVPKTLMVEPTESEPLEELDRLCNAFLNIKEEINDIKNGKINVEDSPLRNAPHTMSMICNDNWEYKYSREKAVVNKDKSYWPTVARVDNVFGDKNLYCSCPSVESFASQEWDPKNA